ncbi:hypothetical protein BDL97_06G014400 [Sphagnum fallax]|nr:hypothetical protein BDL97_06G014400 [Sphagnum fallax]
MSTPSVSFVQYNRPFGGDFSQYQEAKITKQTHKAFSCLPGWQRFGSGVTSFRIVQCSGGKVSCQCSSMLSSDLLLKGSVLQHK